MTNNDEMVLKLKAAAEVIATEHYTDDQWFHYLRLAHHSNILALLAERDAKDKRIAELESQRQMAFMACNRWADKCREAESKLEARTVSVKLPPVTDAQDWLISVDVYEADKVHQALADAGINLEVEE
ncbi:hypothetical protein AAS80_003022 [Escherichia coli]|uniref:ead/Ea22-like family protein n=1 Tax=Escherichia coli TaxID=562 RepID=UPI000E0725D7|nr:ead/Ea22-like family protein [Escherichia coli]EFL6449050.1 hypothetical protein [Escherichia coli]STK94639.1 Uncharacterised protein [Escherichia coli]